ncbi:hypothetical protein R3P38DRAFT_3283817 [Favolaschia claudopus]|uniref:Uncharacterized protein n=1 Tax=Favolaschia claudopus TaxID=2862362 RepID=A0AAW0A6A3_9AGAR
MVLTTPTTATTTTRTTTPTRAGVGGGDVEHRAVVTVLDPGVRREVGGQVGGGNNEARQNSQFPISPHFPPTSFYPLLPPPASSGTFPDLYQHPLDLRGLPDPTVRLGRRHRSRRPRRHSRPLSTPQFNFFNIAAVVFKLRRTLNFNIASFLSIPTSPCAPDYNLADFKFNLDQHRFNRLNGLDTGSIG